MLLLDSGNVLLKPSHRKQLMTWLRRALRLGQKLGDLLIKITVQRVGRHYEVKAKVHDRAGDFSCRFRNHELKDALREIARRLCSRLHDQRLGRAIA